MRLKVRFTPSAEEQFLSLLAYIRRDNPSAAADFRLKAEHSLRRLEANPDSGRRIPEFPELPYREVIVSPYRFFYRAKGRVVWVVAVWHGAQVPVEPHGPT
ncbi:MAG: type II toxin-antitoxin system RelE/ParE family toxin [Acidobacteriota bacterium]